MKQIDFWFSIGSTYSYLTVVRLASLDKSLQESIHWRPFNVRHVMIEQNNIPFKDKPVKTAYMWRDIERRASMYGLSPAIPAPYPLAGLVLANQVALLGFREGWGKEYVTTTYRKWFEQGQPAGEDPNLSDSLRDIGQDPDRVLEAANSDQIVNALADETDTAIALGVFGSPSFVTEDNEVFWGDDRLDDAICWAKNGRLG